jgi:hypothetical protein
MVVHSRRLLFVASALALLAASACGTAQRSGPAREVLQPEVSAVVPVGEDASIGGVAVGEGAVWVAGWDAGGSFVWRIDPERNEVVATIPVAGAHGVAAGEGAVWAVGGTCVEPLPEDPDVCRLDPWVARIEPRSNELVATIPLDPSPGARSADLEPSASWVAAGEGGVWVSVSWDAWTGEVMRIDPRTNEVVARIDTRGHAGEVAVGAGAVWVLSDPAFTDASFGRASLHRIDPGTDAIAATPLREELPMIGGNAIAPTMAVGEDAVWVRSGRGRIPLAVRVDARTGEVVRERIPYFSPVAVTGDGVWFMGAALSRLDPATLEVEESTELGAAFGKGHSAGDAAFDPGTRSIWLAALAVRRGKQSAAVRVGLPDG